MNSNAISRRIAETQRTDKAQRDEALDALVPVVKDGLTKSVRKSSKTTKKSSKTTKKSSKTTKKSSESAKKKRKTSAEATTSGAKKRGSKASGGRKRKRATPAPEATAAAATGMAGMAGSMPPLSGLPMPPLQSETMAGGSLEAVAHGVDDDESMTPGPGATAAV